MSTHVISYIYIFSIVRQEVKSIDISIVVRDHNKELHRANGPRREKTCLQGYVYSKRADQPAHPRSQISALLLFAFWKVPYLSLLQAKFHFST